MADKKFDEAYDALQHQLPDALRADWMVVPRSTGYQLSLVFLLLGGAIALAVVGRVFDIESLAWGWPLALGVLALVNKLVPWSWRGDRDLQEWYAAHKGGA